MEGRMKCKTNVNGWRLLALAVAGKKITIRNGKAVVK
jgi:hypothetical protein